jgi:hypothetical protein
MSAKPLYSGPQPVTIALNSAVDGADVSSNEIDNSTNLFLMKDLEVNLQGSNAAEAGSVAIYMLRGNATGALDDVGNALRLGTVYLDGTTAVRKVIRLDNIPKFCKLRAVHSSSGAYALAGSGNGMSFLGVNIQDV